VVLLRDFRVAGLDDFEQVFKGLAGEGPAFSGMSPKRVFPHHAAASRRTRPMAVYRSCAQPPGAGSAASMADTRHVLARIDPPVHARFKRRSWFAVRKFPAGGASG
jgi:hypothetical protein